MPIKDNNLDIELTPGEPLQCLGNGQQGIECCCDECDYLQLCMESEQWAALTNQFSDDGGQDG